MGLDASILFNSFTTIVNEQYEAVRAKAKDLLDNAKEQYNQLDPVLVTEFKEVDSTKPGRLFPKEPERLENH